MSADIPSAIWRHDLKNQLGIVLGFAEMLLAELDPADPARADIQEIQAAAQRALAMVRALSPEAMEP
jgi:signal transduction histidine kinase